jgi:choline dehydrogenase-like flavoprotein
MKGKQIQFITLKKNVMFSVKNSIIIVLTLLFSSIVSTDAKSQTREYDIVIYGGTSAGIAAAIQSSRMGKSVVLIESSSRIGGLTTGGLGQTDIGNKQVIGGISLEFYEGILKSITMNRRTGNGKPDRNTAMAAKPALPKAKMPCGRSSRRLR